MLTFGRSPRTGGAWEKAREDVLLFGNGFILKTREGDKRIDPRDMTILTPEELAAFERRKTAGYAMKAVQTALGEMGYKRATD